MFFFRAGGGCGRWKIKSWEFATRRSCFSCTCVSDTRSASWLIPSSLPWRKTCRRWGRNAGAKWWCPLDSLELFLWLEWTRFLKFKMFQFFSFLNIICICSGKASGTIRIRFFILCWASRTVAWAFLSRRCWPTSSCFFSTTRVWRVTEEWFSTVRKRSKPEVRIYSCWTILSIFAAKFRNRYLFWLFLNTEKMTLY